ncbi:hypothetical protein D1AOALGA4SA_9432, partial [Olavius algarvensis Delta 1 endosymbiont]
KLLRAGHSDYLLNMDAIAYMHSEKLPKYVIKKIGTITQKKATV